MFMLIRSCGNLPSWMQIMIVSLFAKPKKGVRPIGYYQSPSGTHMYYKGEQTVQKYGAFNVAPHRHTADGVWRQSIRGGALRTSVTCTSSA
eukprot:8725736-Pyramimonas_sp.AAC.1